MIKLITRGLYLANSAGFISCRELAQARPGSELQLKARNLGIALIDDLAAEAQRGDRVCDVLAFRHDHGRLTLLTTNASLDALREAYGDRMIDRVVRYGESVICTDEVKTQHAQQAIQYR